MTKELRGPEVSIHQRNDARYRLAVFLAAIVITGALLVLAAIWPDARRSAGGGAGSLAGFFVLLALIVVVVPALIVGVVLSVIGLRSETRFDGRRRFKRLL